MIFFDIDGTLVDHKGTMTQAAIAFQADHAAAFPQPPEQFAQLWHEIAEKHMQRFFDGEISYKDQRRHRLRELFSNPKLSDQQTDEVYQGYLNRYEQNWHLYPDVWPCLNELARCDCQLGIISNGDSTQQRKKIQTLGLADIFPTVIISGDINFAKPKTEIFHAAANAAGKKPNECTYIGDNFQADIIGSGNASFTPIWINRYGEKNVDNIKTITSLNQLGTLIPQ